jgi:hypothetical protein
VPPLARNQLVDDELVHVAVEGRQRRLVLGEAALLGVEKLLNGDGVPEECEGAPGARVCRGDGAKGAYAGLQPCHVPLVADGEVEEVARVGPESAVQRTLGMLAGEDRSELDAEQGVEAFGRLRGLLAHSAHFSSTGLREEIRFG